MSDTKPGDFVVGPDDQFEDIDLDEAVVSYRGERLTEARAEQIARETLRMARQDKVMPARKPRSSGTTHAPRLQTRVSASTRDKLQAIADERGVPVSTLMRRVLEQFLEQETASTGKAPHE